MHDQTFPLRLEEQPWQALLDSAGEGIWGVDLQGVCTFVNRAACAALGFAPDELVGRNMHEVIHHHHPDGTPYPGRDCSVYNVFRRSQPFTNQIDHLFRKDGTMFYAELSAQPILHDGGTRGAVVTFRDITQTRLAEEALRRSEKLAAVGQLASSIAHEINNPLEAVTNLIYLIRNAAGPEEVELYASQAESELARVADIVTQTLRFHRQQSAAALVELNETIPAIVRLYNTRFRSRGLMADLRLRPTPPAMLLEGDIRQVLNNLIRNAYDAMPKGGVLHVRLRPATCLRTGAPGLRITVADTGTGFLPSIRPHLYEPFHTSKEVTGTGLGLWISKSIVDKHFGRISMRSHFEEDGATPEHGTVFSLWLPLRPPV
ncbi:MAG: two-component system sensor histidine kinase NtrB [Janthinobacterium lividum]